MVCDLVGTLSGSGTLSGQLSGNEGMEGTLSAGIVDTTEILQFRSIYDFPNRGDIGKIYLDQSENATYRWDEAASKFYCVGRDYTEITTISGGEIK